MRPPVLPPPTDPTRRRKKRRQKSFLLGFLGFAFTAGVFVLLAAGAAVAYVIWDASKDLPSSDNLAEYEPPVMTRIHANDGSLIAEYARERRIFVPINTVPKIVIGAFLSAEDKNFYKHNGLDFRGIGIALYKHFVLLPQGSGVSQARKIKTKASTGPRIEKPELQPNWLK